MSTPLRIVFMGSDAIALPLLEDLAARAEQVCLAAVYTQPDRPVGRGQKVTPNAIKVWAQARGLPVYQPEKLLPEVREELAALQSDLALVMAYGHILREDFIATPRLGTLNLHASLLPAYRGASPIQSAVVQGETQTGVSLMRIVRRLDAGPVADVEKVSIEKTDTALEIEAKLAAACVTLVARNLPALAAGSLSFVEQNESRATFCRKLTKEDGRIDWRLPAPLVAARINGLNPWPGAAFQIGDQSIKVGQAEATEMSAAAAAGTIVEAGPHQVSVATGGAGTVRLLRLQRPGGKMLLAAEFLRGYSLPVGQVLESADLAPLVATEPFRIPKKV